MSTERERLPGQPNRASRRAAERPRNPKHLKDPLDVIKRLDQVRNEVDAKAKRVAQNHGHDLTAIVYKGEPYIQEFLSVYRHIHNARVRLQSSGALGEDLNREAAERHLQKVDLFSYEIKGVSLLDIEGIHLDGESHMSEKDVEMIDEIFLPELSFRGRAAEKNSGKRTLRSAITVFIGQAFARPELHIPPSLTKLQQNLTAYLDYYTTLLTNPALDRNSETYLSGIMLFGGPYFRTLIGIYLPARYGITPSSAIKAYEQRIAKSPLKSRAFWRKISKGTFISIAQQAFREGALPDDLRAYQFYNGDVDAKAAKLIQQFYSARIAQDQEQFNAHKKAKEFVQTLTMNMKDLIKEIRHKYSRRIEYDLPNNIAERITVTAQNRQTLIFIIHLPDHLHITLEIDRKGRLFGIPPALSRKIPHIENFLLTDILSPLARRFAPIPFTKKTIAGPLLIPKVQEDPAHELKEKKRRPKRKKRRILFSASVLEVSQSQEPPYPAKFVSYSEEKVRELLPGKKPREKDVEHLMRTIRLFEQGWEQAVRITKDKTIFRLRVGDYRVRLKMIEQGRFVIMDIADRETFDTVKGYRKGFA